MRQKLLYVFVFICYWTGIVRIVYWLNRNRKRTITFHNVLSDDVFVDNVANGVSCSLSDFQLIIEEISRYYTFSLDLEDTKAVTITFDDGYCNQVEVAAPYLLSKDIPAYLFISGVLLQSKDHQSGIGCGNVLVIDLLLHWISYVPNGKYQMDYNGVSEMMDLKDDNRLHIWSSVLWPAFMNDSASKGNNVLKALDKAYSIDAIIEALPAKYVNERLGCATTEQLNVLCNKGWEIGWHTYSHYPLSRLSYGEKVKELIPDSRCPSKVLSFPYGSPREVDRDSLNIAKELGYTAAVSNVNVLNELSGPWFRSRMSLCADPILLHFELSGLKYFLKYRRLLPII